MMSVRTATIKPRVEHMDLNCSNLSTNRKKGKEEKRKRQGRKVNFKKGKEESSQDESSDGWNYFNRDRKQGVRVLKCVCACVCAKATWELQT